MINEALPIKCLEAVILSIHLTDCLSGTDRFVLSFKSEVDECNVYRHVVLVIREGDKYGAVGLSRRADLMFKPLVFNSLQDLILNYKEAYEGNFHALRKIKLGFPIPFGVTSTEKVVWKVSKIGL